MYEGNKLAAEIQTKMNAGSLGGTGGIYTVTYDFDLGTMVSAGLSMATTRL